MPSPTLHGLHHVTAITADAQKNIDFYTQTLGMRMVKLTVNYDDPGSYHLYFGDERGSPGSAMTFFAWPGATRGRAGTGETVATAFSVPVDSIKYWQDRLRVEAIEQRFGEPVLSVVDSDGMKVELIGVERDDRRAWSKGPVPAERGVRGFHSVTLSLEAHDETADVLTGTLAYRANGEDRNRFRFTPGSAPDSITPTHIDLLCQPDLRRGAMGAGTVHHIALRTPDDANQVEWLKRVRERRLNVSPVMERNYFRSIYFREPGGVLFEIATDGPGFATDETVENLGTSLVLPPWMEAHRAEIEAALPKVKLPMAAK